MDIIVIRPEKVCDFCCDPGERVVATHRCEPHVTKYRGAVVIEDCDGLWAACAQCDEHIRREEWHKLALRSINSYINQNGYTPDLVPYVRAMQNDFRRLRKMEA